MRADPFFYVYVITFDEEDFGIFSTREDAEKSLAEQIAGGGPAWDDCRVVRVRVDGSPELGTEEPA